MKAFRCSLSKFSLKAAAAVLTVAGMFIFSGAVYGQQKEAEKKQDAEQTEQTAPDSAAEVTAVPAKDMPASGDLPAMMSVEYIKQFCAAWNADGLMTKGLADSEWIDNDGDKGFKIIQLYRKDCPDSPRVEMQFERQDNKAMCVYAGKVENPDLDRSADYEMFADTKRWIEIGNGDYGPMKAMMFGRLKFKGPKIEAMGNMGPFKNFLLLFGHFPSDPTVCP
ncbi:MAG: SCP2 sterol-binding domain-containing protein [Pseudomonadota bacterium]|nr:SCP2 sterol-binding domain-containing protein [Pseudomonadota bacterium]